MTEKPGYSSFIATVEKGVANRTPEEQACVAAATKPGAPSERISQAVDAAAAMVAGKDTERAVIEGTVRRQAQVFTRCMKQSP